MATDETRLVKADVAADAPAALPAKTAAVRGAGARRVVAVFVRLAFDLLVIDAAVETWQAASPLRVTIAAMAALYFLLTVYVLWKGGRIGGRGWLMDPVVPSVVLLVFLVAGSWSADGLAHGVVALRQPAPVLLAWVFAALDLVGAFRIIGPGGARSWWVRVPVAVAGIYAAASFGYAALARAPFLPLLTGHGVPAGLPWWLQGTWLGAFALLPIAFLRELGAAIARLALFPYVRWMFVFGFACWVAFNVAAL